MKSICIITKLTNRHLLWLTTHCGLQYKRTIHFLKKWRNRNFLLKKIIIKKQREVMHCASGVSSFLNVTSLYILISETFTIKITCSIGLVEERQTIPWNRVVPRMFQCLKHLILCRDIDEMVLIAPSEYDRLVSLLICFSHRTGESESKFTFIASS